MHSSATIARRPLLAAILLLLPALLAGLAPAPSRAGPPAGRAAPPAWRVSPADGQHGPPAGREALDSLAALLPSGPVTVELLAPNYTQRTEEIAGRMGASARRNLAWFQAYTRRFPVSPLPWHPNLGVTRSEYQEYLIGSKHAPMAVTQRATLHFEREPARRRWHLRGWGKLQPLDGLVIDLERNVVEGRRGPLPGLGVVAPVATGDSSLAWRWYGVWKAAHQSGDPQRAGQAMSVSLHLGPLADGTSAALYWTYRRYNNGARQADEFLLLRFPLPR